MHLEVMVRRMFLGFIPYVKTIWVDHTDFVEIYECEKYKNRTTQNMGPM